MTRLLAIAVLSAAILGYEVLLVRLLAIVQWHHFAAMVISIALLGFGASGTAVYLLQDWAKPRFAAVFAGCALAFASTAVVCFALAQALPFNPLALLWEARQLVYLLALYPLFLLPFLFGATAIALAFVSLETAVGRVYGANLLGSGAGALGILGALTLLPPDACLWVIAGLGAAAAGLTGLAERTARARRLGLGMLAVVVALPLSAPTSWPGLRVSEYKGLSKTLDIPDVEILAEGSSPLSFVTLVQSPSVPFRHAPGLSLAAVGGPPPQLGLFTDGGGFSAVTDPSGGPDSLAYLGDMTSALPYSLLERPRVLLLGAGGGDGVLQALRHGAAEVDAVELDAVLAALVRGAERRFSAPIYDRPAVRLHIAEARAFVARQRQRWDLIQIPLLDSFGAALAGGQSLAESHTYTLEAFEDYLGHLSPGGLLAVTRWLKLPPRDSLKLFATALTALERSAIAVPPRSLAMIRGWNTTTLLVKNGALTPDEIAAIRDFAARRWFDLVYLPGMDAAEANRWTLLEAPLFHDAARALAGPERADFIAGYKFDIAPASDDRPYFSDFFTWRALPDLLQLVGQGGAGLLEWGYPLLLATLLQAVLLGGLLILLPLCLKRSAFPRDAESLRVAGYFLALGLAFLFVEIAFIQRFVLFLGHPLTALAVVLAGFLVFAGLGSAFAERLAGALPRRLRAVDLAVAAIAATALCYLWLLPLLFDRLIAAPDAVKIGLSLLLIAPLAVFMGMPFPLGLARVRAARPRLVPWAWGVNGCASVVSALLAKMLAVHLGFAIVVAIAIGLYAVAALALRRSFAGETVPG